MTPLEREIKLALTDEEHARLRAALAPPARILHQENYYLDTRDGSLGRHGYGLRLRIENRRQYILTLKGPALAATDGRGYSTRTEQEARLSAEQTQKALGGVATLAELSLTLPAELGGTEGEALQNLGLLANRRCVYPVALPLAPVGNRGPQSEGTTTLEIEIDESEFPDGSRDYELEIELQALPPDQIPTERAIREFLAQWGIPWHPRPASKLARFLQRRALPPTR